MAYYEIAHTKSGKPMIAASSSNGDRRKGPIETVVVARDYTNPLVVAEAAHTIRRPFGHDTSAIAEVVAWIREQP